MKTWEIIARFLIYLNLLVLMISCAVSGISQPEKPSPPSRISETQTREQPKSSPSGKEQENYRTREILVKFREGTDVKAINAIQKKLRLKTVRMVIKPNLYLMEILDGSSVESVMKRLQEYQEVIYSEPNLIYRINERKESVKYA